MKLKNIINLSIKRNIVNIIPSPLGDGVHEPVCKIGDNWFYFAGFGSDNKTVEEIKEELGSNIGQKIADAMLGLDKDELLYYLLVLHEHGMLIYPTFEWECKMQTLNDFCVIETTDVKIPISTISEFRMFRDRVFDKAVLPLNYCFTLSNGYKIPCNSIIPFGETNCDRLFSENRIAVRGKDGWFISTINAFGDDFQGLDTEFIPDTLEDAECECTYPRVLFEQDDKSELHVCVWDEPKDEDYGTKIVFPYPDNYNF